MKQKAKAMVAVLALLGLFSVWNSWLGQDADCLDPYDIKMLPFKDERINDNTYNAFMSNKKQSIFCLAKSITDTRKMYDPRQAPPYEGLVVGDTAFFVLARMLKKPLKSFLPKNIQDDFEKEGIYAYFKYVKKDLHRRELQDRLFKYIDRQKNIKGAR